MSYETKLGCALICISVLVVGCSSQPSPPIPEDRPPADAPSSSPKIEPSPAAAEPTTSTSGSEPAATTAQVLPPPLTAKPPVPRPTPPPVEPPPPKVTPPPPATTEPPPAPPDEPAAPDPVTAPTSPPPTEPAPKVVDPGGPVEVGATRPGLSRIGTAKCKLCHKVQFASWTETAHATRTPPLDCEDCHGPGSEYKGLKVMKDPEQARAAGLVMPGQSFCSKCHTSGWSDDLMTRAHAHKVEES